VSAIYFVLFILHAIFDGWTLGILLETLMALYDGKGPLLYPYTGFVD